MTKELNEQRQNQELWSNVEQPKEQMNVLRQNLGWHLKDVKLIKEKMNRTINGVPMMSNLRIK